MTHIAWIVAAICGLADGDRENGSSAENGGKESEVLILIRMAVRVDIWAVGANVTGRGWKWVL